MKIALIKPVATACKPYAVALWFLWPQMCMQERTLNMIRNLLAHCESTDVKQVLEWSQGQICDQLIARVNPGAAHPSSTRVHALYSLVNIAAAGVSMLLVTLCQCSKAPPDYNCESSSYVLG